MGCEIWGRVTTSGFFWLKRATRTAAITASVPDMWKEISSRPDTVLSILMFSSVIGSSKPRKSPFDRAFAQPASINFLYASYPHTLTPYEPEMSRAALSSMSMIVGPLVFSSATDGSR